MSTIEIENKILGVLAADLPETARIMNAAAITEEIELGREVIVDDDDLPPQETYDAHQEVLDAMVDTNVLQTGEVLGMKVYGLSHSDNEGEQG